EVMMPHFWDSKEMIHVEYLEKGTLIKGAYYAKLLKKKFVQQSSLACQRAAPSAGQFSFTQKSQCDGQWQEVQLLNSFSPTLISRPNPMRLFVHFASNNELIWAAESCSGDQNKGFSWH
ncbi:hypothetical protein CAPTEDRAFT_89259, partial [Capitella teleta]